MDTPAALAGRIQRDLTSEVDLLPEKGLPVTVEDLDEERVACALVGGTGVLGVSYGDAQTSSPPSDSPPPRKNDATRNERTPYGGTSRQYVLSTSQAVIREPLIGSTPSVSR